MTTRRGSGGHIKLYRKIMDHWVWDQPEHLKAFVWLLLRARWKDGEVEHRGSVYIVRRGQLITTVSEMAEAVGLSWDRTKRVLGKLAQERPGGNMPEIADQTLIKTRSGTRIDGHLITVLKYEDYQDGDDQTSDQNADQLPPKPRNHRGSDADQNDARSRGSKDLRAPKKGKKEKKKEEEGERARRHRWDPNELRRVVAVKDAPEALAYFVEWGWIRLAEMREEGRPVPLEPKASGGRGIACCKRLLDRWGGGHFVRLVRQYYETTFSEWESRQREGFPSLSHFEAVDLVVNGAVSSPPTPTRPKPETEEIPPPPPGMPQMRRRGGTQGGAA